MSDANMRPGTIHLILFTLCLTLTSEVFAGDFPGPPDICRECVILLHGLGRSDRSMKKMEVSLRKQEYLTWNRGYPSTEYDLKTLADMALPGAVRYCRENGALKIHFVTHSLGGILVGQYLSEHDVPDLGRIVMLAPPNRGSEVADKLKSFPPYEWFTGPAGQEIGTDPQSVPNTLPPIHAELGIIAGSSTSDPWFSPLIPGKDDGKVSVESTGLEEMTDFLVVAFGHTFIMNKPEVIRQVVFFLQNGRFDHGSVD